MSFKGFGQVTIMIQRMRLETLAAFLVLMAALGVLCAPSPALAQSLDQLRAQGVVAERFDGYVEVRQGNAPAAVKAQVDKVNAERRAIYRKRASEQGVQADQVARVYAKQILKSAPKGTFFRQENGKLVQK